MIHCPLKAVHTDSCLLIPSILSFQTGVLIAGVGCLSGYCAYLEFFKPCKPTGGILPFDIGSTIGATKNIFDANDEFMIGVFILDIVAALLLVSGGFTFFSWTNDISNWSFHSILSVSMPRTRAISLHTITNLKPKTFIYEPVYLTKGWKKSKFKVDTSRHNLIPTLRPMPKLIWK